MASKEKIKAVVFGYHNIGFECLRLLIKKGVDVAMVVTHEDDPGEEIWFNSVYRLAKKNKIPVYFPKNPNSAEFIDRIRRADPDIIFSFYYRNILSPEILKIPRLGAFNMHGSLLPRYRGRCPVNWVIVKGEKETGVTIHRMTEKPDRGNIVVQRRVPIRFSDTALTLFNRITKAAPSALSEFLRLLEKGKIEGVPQDNARASYFGGRKAADGMISWDRPPTDIYNLVRAVTHPYPGAFTFYNEKKIFIWNGKPVGGKVAGIPGIVEKTGRSGVRVSTGSGVFLIKRAQSEGGKEKDAAILFSEMGIKTGNILGR